MAIVLAVLGILTRLLFAEPVFSQSRVLINEFLIEPAPQSVELINVGSESADISGWYVDDSAGTTYFTVPGGNLLLPNTCGLFSGNFNLNKASADTVRLFDRTAPPTSFSARLIDSFSYQMSSGSGISYFRLPDGSDNWTTGEASLGLYNETFLSCSATVSPILTITDEPSTATVTPVPTPTSVQSTKDDYNNILISEAMVYPESGEHEWVELYNNNGFPAYLNDWYLDDPENQGSSPKKFSLEIPSYSYGVIEMSSSIFNNSGDQVRLLNYALEEKDSFEYSSATKNKTFGRISVDEQEFCLQDPSKNTANNDCIEEHEHSPDESTQIIPPAVYTPTTSKPEILSAYDGGQQPNTKTAIYMLSTLPNSTVQNSTENPLVKQPYSVHVKSLSIISFSYSLLTIISVLLKMNI